MAVRDGQHAAVAQHRVIPHCPSLAPELTVSTPLIATDGELK